jgi:VWFA-related protein
MISFRNDAAFKAALEAGVRRWLSHPCVAQTVLAISAFAQSQPIFHAGTRLVQVDVVVRNKSGPVAGLRKEDFTLFDEGSPQPISVFSVTAQHSDKRATPLPAGTVSNRLNRLGEAAASATILLIDRLNTPIDTQPYANQKVIRFVQASGGRERVGIYTLGAALHVVQDLTDDPDRLERAARSLKPQDSRRLSADVSVDSTGDAITDAMVRRSLEGLEDITVSDHVQLTREALEAIARHLAGVPGRKNLIWISGSFPIFIQRAHYSLDFSKDVDAASRALNDANVAVFPVDARGLTGSPAGQAEESPQQTRPPRSQPAGPSGVDTMNTLAALTGGRAFYNSNGIEDSIAEAIDDAKITYTLGFYPAEGAFDGKFHKLMVKVDQKNVSLRFRQGYFAAKTDTAAPTAPRTLSQLLQASLDATAIGITASAAADTSQAGSYQVRVVVDLHDIHLEHRNNIASGSVDVSLFIERSKTARTITRKIEIPDEQLAAALEKGVEIDGSIQSDNRTGMVRVVALDPATGASGSVRVPLGPN